MTKFVLTLTLLVVVMAATIESKPWIQGVGKNNISLNKLSVQQITVWCVTFQLSMTPIKTEANNERSEIFLLVLRHRCTQGGGGPGGRGRG
jgi:hypothetical protein